MPLAERSPVKGTSSLFDEDIRCEGSGRAMPTAITAVRRYPEIRWVAAQAYDLLPDGSRVELTPLIEPDYVTAGVVAITGASTTTSPSTGAAC